MPWRSFFRSDLRLAIGSLIPQNFPEVFPEDSQIWRISRERVILLAGPAAAILQIAHPEVALGVHHHSGFREDSLTRLRRTLDAVYTVTFGSPSEVQAMYAVVGEKHASVRGTTPRAYSAFSPDAQMWVLATLIMLAVESYEKFISPLNEDEKSEYYRQMREFGKGFGLSLDYGPRHWNDFRVYYEEKIHAPEMGSLPISRELARHIAQPRHPFYLRALWPVSVFMAREFLPSPLAEKLGFAKSPSHGLGTSVLQYALPSVLRMTPPGIRFEEKYLQALARLGKDSAI